MKRKPPRRGRMDPVFRAAILARDNHTCQAPRVDYHRDLDCSRDLHVHHRILSSKIDEEWNCITLCELHHHWAHDVDRAGAERAGLIERKH